MRAVLFLLPLAALGGLTASEPGVATREASAFRADTNQRVRDSLMNEVLREIRGREQQPAESVFKNIKTLRGMPAERIPRIMNVGFGRSLGVACAHCHVVTDWASEEKPQKQIAREMWAMMNAINAQYLANIRNLKSERPTVNCTTCHRGEVKPATNLPPDAAR